MNQVDSLTTTLPIPFKNWPSLLGKLAKIEANGAPLSNIDLRNLAKILIFEKEEQVFIQVSYSKSLQDRCTYKNNSRVSIFVQGPLKFHSDSKGFRLEKRTWTEIKPEEKLVTQGTSSGLFPCLRRRFEHLEPLAKRAAEEESKERTQREVNTDHFKA